MPSASFTTGPGCVCCTGGTHVCTFSLGTAILECRNRGGTASLCGYSEYSSPSSPPKKYRRKDLSDAGFYRCLYDNTGCTSSAGSDTSSYSGFTLYDSATCILDTSSLTHTVWSHTGPLVCAYPNLNTGSDHADPACWTEIVRYTSTSTPTTCTRSGKGCVGSENFIGSQTQTLSVEDTETDGLTRLLAGAGGTWGAWVPPDTASCLARWEQRTSSFSWAYFESQFRVRIIGLTPVTAYHFQIDILRSPFGTMTYTKIATYVYSFTTDGAGGYNLADDIPNLQGYDTTVDTRYGVGYCVY